MEVWFRHIHLTARMVQRSTPSHLVNTMHLAQHLPAGCHSFLTVGPFAQSIQLAHPSCPDEVGTLKKICVADTNSFELLPGCEPVRAVAASVKCGTMCSRYSLLLKECQAP